jgi:GMP synthase (glutamine-hydrolysing)
MSHVLVLRHVSWEELGGFASQLDQHRVSWRYVDRFEGVTAADLVSARAVIVMGGPMSVYQTQDYPFLAREISAVGQAARAGVPMLGVCLGSQVLAAALGAHVYANPRGKEIGWAPITAAAAAAADPIARCFRPRPTVLHWHGDIFDVPVGAVCLASSDLSACQAFRWGSVAWGLLFHIEVDAHLARTWIREPTMVAEVAALDPELPSRIATQALQYQDRCRELQAVAIDALLTTARR